MALAVSGSCRLLSRSLASVLALVCGFAMTRGSQAQFWGSLFNWATVPPRSPSAANSAPDPSPGPAEIPTDWLPPPPAFVPTAPCVAAFDFDGVLRAAPPEAKDQNVPAPEARSVIQASKNAGWEIAICSANDSPATMKLVLGQRLDPVTFSPQFFNSPAFQTHNDDKSVTLTNLIRYYGTSPQCVMFFDDKGWNKDYAKQVGVIFIHTPPETGITYYDFQRAQQAIPRYCKCAA
ncbi:hypothetical protein VOLCADRAFT_118129 [Volvox carteri f. nagariensis]|uniref:Acid phosphatase n=1 Tax=Volvox carteri f. nagariensis TaxID=3068 RepID=D8U1Y5_VOLCA|nr:uncharacterized protein VOLCADRAFT_118129 [Volvox carteri f. nagariensis]EFJ46265.1 hypothetical protein VOLCADRAFT_118129 [Volvox carteri f. nagariensis]|eukprot:XP_002952712.1 hypothetical protein VOLCADRAFT_118129 [Volvox carteri f. nagariensis]